MKKILILFVAAMFLLAGLSAQAKKPLAGGGGNTLNPPTNLSATAVSASGIDLSWLDNSGNESGFKIERSFNGTSFIEVAEVGVDVTIYFDTGLLEATTYYYRVRAYRIQGRKTKYSDYSNVSSDTTFSAVPSAPSDLWAQAGTSSPSAISLYWIDTSNNEDGFRIERSMDGVSFTEIDTVGVNAAFYWDIGLAPTTTYYYRVRAYNTTGESGYSNIASDTTFDIPPADPLGLSGTAVSTSGINLTWLDNADNEDGFKIERSLNGVDFTEINTVGANFISYSDAGLSSATTYYYRIRAYNSYGNSGYSNVANDTTFDIPPADPTSLTGEAYSASSTPFIGLNWQDNSNNEDWFIIERSTNALDYIEIDIAPVDSTYFTDWFVSTSTTYYYRVKATNDYGESGYSNVAEVPVL